MNILCIGNSFSSDATRYLQEISNNELFVRNLYIGGCSLETHVKNIKENNAFYEYQKNDKKIMMSSIQDALKRKRWHFISIQQVSHFSGLEETYEPYIGFLVDYLKKECPKAEIVFHRTWSYDPKSTHEGFKYYDRDSEKMYNMIVEASSKFAKKYNLRVIDNATSIQNGRKLKEFDVNNGPLSMNRDGFHLSLDYGRYLAALTMYAFFTGKDPKDVTFEPANTDHKILEKLKKCVALKAVIK